MNLTLLLDVAIGMALVYLSVSLFVTIINEHIAHLFQLRGRHMAANLEALIAEGVVRGPSRRRPRPAGCDSEHGLSTGHPRHGDSQPPHRRAQAAPPGCVVGC